MEIIQAGETVWRGMNAILERQQGQRPFERLDNSIPLAEIRLHAPIQPISLRDFYAFEGHVMAASGNRGRQVPEEWYQFPVFYFSNPMPVFGPDETVPIPGYTQEMDYELEIACVIGKAGIDIPPEKAEEYIFAYTILNDWSARDIQRLEMRVGLGPAKGKDFAFSLGPWLVTPDDLLVRHTDRTGVYDLDMKAMVNGVLKSQGNLKDIHYSFGDLIARASAGTSIYPGEVIGSGTVSSGCLLELTQGQGPWLQPGDRVTLEIEHLGKLSNQIQ